MVKPEFKITKKQIYEIFDNCYPKIKEVADQVGLQTTHLEDGRDAIRLTIVCKKDKTINLGEIDIQDGDIFYLKF
jgi:hypothetical protein